MSEKLEFLKAVLERTHIPEQDKSFVINLVWTQDELVPIENKEQFEQYSAMKLQIEKRAIAGVPLEGLKSASEAQKAALVEFMRSPEGVRLNALDVRLMLWTVGAPG